MEVKQIILRGCEIGTFFKSPNLQFDYFGFILNMKFFVCKIILVIYYTKSIQKNCDNNTSTTTKKINILIYGNIVK